MRVFARRERPHPGAKLSLFEIADSWRYSLPGHQPARRDQGLARPGACIDAAHRVHARVEDVIRTGKDTGLGHFPYDYGLNKAWLDAAMTACILLSWLKFLALDGDLATAEPKTLRYRVLRAAARLVRGGRRGIGENRRQLALGRGGHHRLAAYPGHPASPLTRKPVPASKEGNPGARGTPPAPVRQPGHCHTPALKSSPRTQPARGPAAAINPDE
jgi:hypothetical protein